ncbi:MAG: Calx-beta domain-containing protein, partial [bacterium]
MKSLLVLLSLLFTLVLSGCKEGTIVYDVEFPRADSEEAQDSSVAGGDSAGREADPAVTITEVSVQEGAGTVQVTLSLDKAVPGGFILDVSTQASSALSGVGNDFNALSSQSLIFNGTPAETKTVSITINDDTLVEADETFQLVISKLWGTTDPVSITDTGTITINDDDSAAITIADVSVSENAGTATVTLTLDKATSGAFSLDLSTTDGSATTSDNDYSSLISQLVSFSGNPSENQTVSIMLNDDLKVEDNETFTVVMSNLSGLQANISLSDTAQVTITDNDNATVTIDNVSAAENSGSAVATLRVDNPVQGGFWVSLLRADGSATLADSDYSAGIDNISFAGTAGETQTVSIPLVDDLKLEADETMLLTLGSASRPEIVISDNATVTITNDDTASLTIADVSVAESAGTATISVVLDNPVDGGFAVDVSSLDGTATTVDSDYTALSSPNQSFT